MFLRGNEELFKNVNIFSPKTSLSSRIFVRWNALVQGFLQSSRNKKLSSVELRHLYWWVSHAFTSGTGVSHRSAACYYQVLISYGGRHAASYLTTLLEVSNLQATNKYDMERQAPFSCWRGGIPDSALTFSWKYVVTILHCNCMHSYGIPLGLKEAKGNEKGGTKL